VPRNAGDRHRPRRRRAPGVALAFTVAEAVALWLRTGRPGGNVAVRCHSGHVFRTIWLPGVSLKSIRLAWWRIQRCPVGRHWSLVSPVKESDLSLRERRSARRHRDLRIP
jgi:hypothetical protein